MKVEWESDGSYFNSWATSNLNVGQYDEDREDVHHDSKTSDTVPHSCIVLDLSGKFSNVPCSSSHLSKVKISNDGSLFTQFEGFFSFLCKRRGVFLLKHVLEVAFKTFFAADVVLNRGSDSVLPAAFPYYPGKLENTF